MNQIKLSPLVCGALLALSACDDPPTQKQRPTFENDAGADEADAGADASQREGPQYAAVSSDYNSTSISLLGADGELLADDYINSGSMDPGLTAFLSGDVELPTRSNDPGVLVLIDRFKNDVI
ncbi:MAG TPA: hypothetical protein VFZ61_22895, partial [Polyangiales bacterium]